MEGMSSEQLSWHLPGKWSAAEVLEHLYLTYVGTIRGLEKVMTRGAPLATRPSMAQRVLTFMVVELGYIPAGREAPAIVQPRGLPVEQVRNEIWAKLAAMDAIIAQCEARFGRHVKLLDHPILGALTSTTVENAPSGARTAPPETAAPAAQTHVRNSVNRQAVFWFSRFRWPRYLWRFFCSRRSHDQWIQARC